MIILSQRIDAVTLPSVVQYIAQSVRSKKQSWIFAMNLHILIELKKNPELKKKHDDAQIIYADGMPLVWISHLQGTPLPSRVSGTDLVEKLLATQKNIFLLGPEQDIVKKIQYKYPTAICGSFTPPFGKAWDKILDQKILQKIRTSKAKILMVGVGSLKQEKWIMEYLAKTPVRVGLGVGSGLEILAGIKPRAPQFVQNIGLEWLWRICQEPKRLLPRYIEDVVFLVKDYLKSKIKYV